MPRRIRPCRSSFPSPRPGSPMLFDTIVRSVASECSTSASISVERCAHQAEAADHDGVAGAHDAHGLLGRDQDAGAHVGSGSHDRRYVRCRRFVKTAFDYVEKQDEQSRASRASTSQSLERGLAILSSFSAGRQLIGVSEIAQELGLTRSTAHRYIATLAQLGYLHQDAATRKYALGPRVLDLGFTAINSMELRHVAAPHLHRLCDETGNTVNLAILDDVDIVYVERFRASAPAPERDRPRPPCRLPAPGVLHLHGQGAARVPAGEPSATTLLDRTTFARRGPNTRTSKTALLADLRRIRETGIAVNNEELAYGLRSVAVPVFSAGGEVVAALNLAAHRTMVSLDDLIARLGPIMQRTAAGISAQLGYRATPGTPRTTR